MTDQLTTSSNDGSTVDSSCSLRSKQENCRKLIHSLEVEKEKMSASLELVQTKLEMQNSLLEQYNENKKLFDENTKLSTNLNILNSEMAKFKEERELNLEELFTIKKDKEELIKTNEKLLEENTQISFKLKEVTSDNNKFKEDFDSKLEELTKTKEENQELKNELECAKNKLSQLQSEELEKENKFKEEMEKVLIERKQATDQADILKIDHKRIYDLYTTQQAEFKDLNVQNGNLASENKKLKLDFEHLQERSQNARIINDSLNDQIAELTSELEKLRKDTEKLVRFVSLPNYIFRVNTKFTCCESNCLKSNLLNGTCASNNGFVRVHEDGKVKYHIVKEEKNNKWIGLYALESFIKEIINFHYYSLFYYEVTMIKEATNHTNYAGIGFNNTTNIFLCNNSTDWEKYQKFTWNDGDVFGCGLVFPPEKESQALPYVYFTKNGKKIGNDISLKKEDDNFCPYIGLMSCSVKTNFGNDLMTNPFRYNVSEHFY